MLFKQKGSYMGTTASLMLTISYYIDDLPTSLVCPSFPNWGPTLLHCAIDRLLVYSPPPTLRARELTLPWTHVLIFLNENPLYIQQK